MLKCLQAVGCVKFFAKITACIFLITACDKFNFSKPIQQSQADKQSNQTILKRAIYSAVLQLDPHKVKVSADASPIRDLLVGLVAYSEKGDVIPAIAQNWFTEDEKAWLFILDEKAKWSNGEPVTAHDFVASWQRLIDPENHSLSAKQLVDIGVENAKQIQEKKSTISELGVVALNDYILQIRLDSPNPRLPRMLAHTALLPTYKGIEPSGDHFVSNATYYIDRLEPKKMVLKAKDEHIPFQTVEYELITTIQDYASFDIVENPLLSQVSNIVKFPRLCTYYYEFNFNDPQLNKKDIREALRAMIAPANIGQEYGIISQSIIPSTLAKNWEKPWKPIVVEQLLKKAGISSHHPLKLSLLYDKSDINIEIANQVARALSQSELFHITLKMVDFQTLNQLREQKAYQLVRASECADYPEPAVFLRKFHSQSPDNLSGYQNQLVDQKLERLHSDMISKEERALLIQEINEQLYNDVVVLPLFQYQYRVGIVSSLWGIDLNNNSEVIYSKDLRRILN